MKIKSIEAFPIDVTPHPTTQPRVPLDPDARRFNEQAFRYPELAGSALADASSQYNLQTGCLVTAEDGTQGFCQGMYAATSCDIINQSFAPRLIGQDCMATEKLYDMMNRMSMPHGRAGLASYAISTVDVALWDLKAKLLGVPVYELLGGPQKDDIIVYGSCTQVQYGLVEQLRWVMELGFRATKVFLTYGPQHGLPGLHKNVEMITTARETVGPDVDLAVDMWLGMDVEYAVRLIEACRGLDIKWFEDPFRNEDMVSYRQLRQRVPWQTLATGEHWYTPQPFAQAAAEGLVDIFQPDPLWVGGISAMVRIAHLAEAFGMTAISHAGMNFPYGQHLTYATPCMPWGERSQGVSAPGVPLEEMTRIPGTPVVQNGRVVPSDAPGFGQDITNEWLESVRR